MNLAAAESLHHGVQRAHFADILKIIQNGAIDPPIFVDEHALGGLNECLVVVHIQHHEEVVLGLAIELVSANDLDRVEQQLVRCGQRLGAVGVLAEPALDNLSGVRDLEPPTGSGEQLSNGGFRLVAADFR